MFCMKCGNELRADARFCTVCGFQIPVIEKESVEASTVVSEPIMEEQTGKLIIKGYKEWFVKLPVTVEINGDYAGVISANEELILDIKNKSVITFKCGDRIEFCEVTPEGVTVARICFDKTLTKLCVLTEKGDNING